MMSDDSEFFEACIKLLKVPFRDLDHRQILASKNGHDILEVVTGFACLSDALENYRKDAPVFARTSVVMPAVRLLQALTTGHAHPIFKFIDGVRNTLSSRPPELISRSVKPYIFGLIVP